MPKILRVLIFLLATAPFAWSGDVVAPRGGLNNAFLKLWKSERGDKDEKGERTGAQIVYFGGSITAGAGASKPELCYRALLTAHLQQEFPHASIAEINATLGGTGSWLGAFRVRSEIFSHWPPVDLVIVEFAVNDNGSSEAQICASMEGIVRQLRASWPKTDIVFVYTLLQEHLELFKKGQLPVSIQAHEKIAAQYNIPSINMAQFAAQKINAGELTINDFAKDGVHPTDRGYALYLDALKPYVAQCKAAAEKLTAAVDHPLPETLSPHCMINARMIPYERVQFDANWKLGQASPVEQFLHVPASDVVGATVTLKFKGDCVGFYDAIGPDTGDIETSVDGGEWKYIANYDAWCQYYRAHYRIVAENLDPNAQHEVRIRVAEKKDPKSKGRFFRPAFFLINGDSPSAADPYPGLTPLQTIDAIYSKMEPLKFVPLAERWQLLPETMKKLRDGPTLRLVMLGDSIVNDTSSSQFELLLMRQYPKCKIEKVTSVRGSTGCWWYKDENRVQEWVLKHNPDLLLIGGISQHDDVDSIREVIHQVRAKLPKVEVLLMTGAFGRDNPQTDAGWTAAIDPSGASYRAKLKKLAAEEKCEFLDVTGAWGQYIKDSEKSLGWFKRDAIHANERGFQILGRILERYFAEK